MTPIEPGYQSLLDAVAPLRERLFTHPVYSRVRSLDDLRAFARHHVYAVWDFMSLLKALQRDLTCVRVPWVPPAHPEVARLVNEIVLGEETDLLAHGVRGHYDLYREAMGEMGASTREVDSFLLRVRSGCPVPEALVEAGAPGPAQAFVRASFEILAGDSTPMTAAAFTLGREDVIPDMFQRLVDTLDAEHPGRLERFRLYLERHIELDGEEHGPAARRMIELLCGEDPELWRQARIGARRALEARLALWDGVVADIGPASRGIQDG